MTVQALREPLDSTGRHLGRTAEPERWTLIRQAYLTLLGEARSFKRSGSRLTLFDRHGNESLVFGAARP
jgi:hypothetical protein